MLSRRCITIVALNLLGWLLVLAHQALASPNLVSARQPTQSVLRDIQPSDIEYLGAFRIPVVRGDPDPRGFSGGGHLIAYTDEPGGDSGLPGSIWSSGFWCDTCVPSGTGGYVGRFSIPTPVIDESGNGNYPQATMLVDSSPFGVERFNEIDNGRPFMGSGYCYKRPDGTRHLIASVYGYYNESDGDLPHIFHAPTSGLSFSGAIGVSERMHVGPRPSDLQDTGDDFFSMRHGGYLFEMPRAWANEYAKGKWLAVGQGDREGGHTEYDGTNKLYEREKHDNGSRNGCNLGPGFSLINPDTLIAHDEFGYEIDAVTVLHYNADPQPTWGDSLIIIPDGITASNYTHFEDKDRWMGMACISNVDFNAVKVWPDGIKMAVAALVVKCEATSFYWHAVTPETPLSHDTPDCCGNTNTGFICGEEGVDPPGGCTKAYIWLMAMDEIVDILNGQRGRALSPYAALELDMLWGAVDPCERGLTIRGVSYSVEHSILFVAERIRAGCCQEPTAIHMFKIN